MIGQMTLDMPTLDVGALLERSKAERTLDFDLGSIDPLAPETQAFLLDVAELRSRSLFGFKFECSLATSVTQEQATLLGRGGVVLVHLLDAERETVAGPPAYMQQLETVRALFEAGIDVRWNLDFVAATRGDRSTGELLRALDAARNLPPPGFSEEARSLPSAMALQSLDESVSAWREEFRVSALTFARGPGFMRLRDRRPSKGSCRFYTLKGQQADVLRFCTKIRSQAEVVSTFNGIPCEKLAAFLERLVDDGLMVRHDDYYLSLPTRRTLGERWSSEIV